MNQKESTQNSNGCFLTNELGFVNKDDKSPLIPFAKSNYRTVLCFFVTSRVGLCLRGSGKGRERGRRGREDKVEEELIST